MSTINQLDAIDALATGDLVVVFDASNGDARKATLAALLTWLEDNIVAPRWLMTKQYATPTATDWSVSFLNTGADIWLHISPAANYADATLVMPADPVDQQEVWFDCRKLVTAFVIDPNGHTMTWTLTTIATITNTWKLKFDSVTDSWYFL